MTTIQRIWIALVLALAGITGCEPKKSGAFVVTGTITNAPGKKVLLMELPFASTEPLVLDSTTLNNKGQYTLRANAREEGIYRIVLENGPDVILINDVNTVRIDMDVNNYANYKVQESPATQSLQDLFYTYRKDDSTLITTFRLLDTLQNQQVADSIMVVTKMQRDREMATMNENITSFINKSRSPAAIFYALGLGSRTMPPQELKPLVDRAANKYKEHSGIARIKSLLTQQLAVKAPEHKLLYQPAPDLTMPDGTGKPLSISSFKGKYVLVDFWASWCGPCRAENPNLVAAYNSFKDRNFTILGVSLDEDKNAWLQAVEKDKLTWPQMSDLKMWDSQAIPVYRFDAIPFNVLIDPTGKIIAQGIRGEALAAKLEEVLQ